jgi:hypothetical protein
MLRASRKLQKIKKVTGTWRKIASTLFQLSLPLSFASEASGPRLIVQIIRTALNVFYGKIQ